MTKSDKSAHSPEGIGKDVGETAAAVAEKADDKKQAQAKARELGDKAKEIAPESAVESVHQAQRFTQKNSIPVVIGVSLLVGFILGRIFSR